MISKIKKTFWNTERGREKKKERQRERVRGQSNSGPYYIHEYPPVSRIDDDSPRSFLPLFALLLRFVAFLKKKKKKKRKKKKEKKKTLPPDDFLSDGEDEENGRREEEREAGQGRAGAGPTRKLSFHI